MLGRLAQALTFAATMLVGRPARAVQKNQADPEFTARLAEARRQQLAAIPFERIETTGAQALATWERLKASKRGWPVVIGGDEELYRIREQLIIMADEGDTVRILDLASKLVHPRDLQLLRDKDTAEGKTMNRAALNGPDAELPMIIEMGTDGNQHQLTPAEVRKRLEDEAAKGPSVGEWPDKPVHAWPGLTIAFDLEGRPLDKVHILLIPTDEGAAVPAFLRWGGWNANPRPEYHIAALRSWHERYGAELVGITGDVINLRLARRPATREAALALAREQYLYCEDIVDQGTGTLARLAATRMQEDWWFFWWD
jgi:hypothetical protein